VTVYSDDTVGDYDGADDTLVGIWNNSSSSVDAVTVTGPGSSLAGFDGDGLCTYISCTWPAPTGYEGPQNTFTTDPSNLDSAEVDFSGGLAPGASTYFSLEGTLTSASLTARQGHLNPGVQVSDRAMEPTVAVNPVDNKNIVVAYNHRLPDGSFRCGYAASFNGGVDWPTRGDLPLPAEPHIVKGNGDPAVTFTSSGRLILSCLAGSDEGSTLLTKTNLYALYTVTSPDGGRTLNSPIIVRHGITSQGDSLFPDQESMAASPSSTATYVCFTMIHKPKNGDESSSVFLMRLATNGFPANVGVVTAGLHESLPLSCTVSVANSGRVWVAWFNNDKQKAETRYTDNASGTTGMTFSPLVVLGDKAGDAEDNIGRHVWIRASHRPGDDSVLAAWETDGSSGPSIQATTRIAGTWSATTTVVGHGFQPALDWGSDGVIALGFYTDPFANQTSGSYTLMRGTSLDALAAVRLQGTASDATSSFTPFGKFGDYAGVAEVSGTGYGVWTDNSSGAVTVWIGHT
jgi:hypothetical protein